MTFDKFVEVLWRQDVTLRAFGNSFLFAGSAALILSFLAIALAYALERKAGKFRRLLEAILEIPYALPGVVLAIACILLFLRPLPLIGVSIYATPFIIVFAYLARFLPLALKPPLAAMAVLARDQEEASALDGANAWQRLRHVIVPNLLHGRGGRRAAGVSARLQRADRLGACSGPPEPRRSASCCSASRMRGSAAKPPRSA